LRCWYYRSEHNAFNCLRKGGDTCYAVAGDNRYHSIFGAVGGCLAVNPGSIAPVLVALDAGIRTSKRTVAAWEFFAAHSEKTTVLDGDEIVVGIELPLPADGTRSAFVKFALRKSFDFPIVSCAASITNEGGIVSAARICLNAVYNLPYIAIGAEEAIIGKPIDEASAEAAGVAAVKDAVPLAGNRYKVQIAKIVVKRTLLAAPPPEQP
jgi:xanthine dehydrogenase YagS FAD-binding subunit